MDFSAAFDSNSQVFLTEALLEAGARHKRLAIFRSMYPKASIRTIEADGNVTFTDYFDIRRGVVQGDCFSAPLQLHYIHIWVTSPSVKVIFMDSQSLSQVFENPKTI